MLSIWADYLIVTCLYGLNQPARSKWQNHKVLFHCLGFFFLLGFRFLFWFGFNYQKTMLHNNFSTNSKAFTKLPLGIWINGAGSPTTINHLNVYWVHNEMINTNQEWSNYQVITVIILYLGTKCQSFLVQTTLMIKQSTFHNNLLKHYSRDQLNWFHPISITVPKATFKPE